MAAGRRRRDREVHQAYVYDPIDRVRRPFDPWARDEPIAIHMQWTDEALALLLLMEMKFGWGDAALLFALWLAQFLEPSWRLEVLALYLLWSAALIVLALAGRRPFKAPGIFLASGRTVVEDGHAPPAIFDLAEFSHRQRDQIRRMRDFMQPVERPGFALTANAQ